MALNSAKADSGGRYLYGPWNSGTNDGKAWRGSNANADYADGNVVLFDAVGNPLVFDTGSGAGAARVSLYGKSVVAGDTPLLLDSAGRVIVAPITGQAGVAGGAGAVGATTQRVTLASDDPAVTVLGAKADAKSTATDTTAVSLMSVWKQISASVQAIATSVAGTLTIGTHGIRERAFAVTGGTMTRPANVTPYTANDAISNNATAGSVTVQTFTLSDTNDDPIVLERMRLATTDTGLAASKRVRAWLYAADPTASSGIVGGDNAAFSTKQGTFIGSMSGTFRAFSDGGVAVLVPDEGSRIITNPVSGARTLYVLYQTLDDFTPSANSTTLIPTLEGFQAKAA